MTFASATAVDAQGNGRYAATIDEGWDIAGNANGGYLLAIIARAITAETGKPDPLTITGHFLAPGHAGPAEVEVEVRRSGGRHSTASATLVAEGRPVLVALATTTDLSLASGPERVDTKPPDLPDPEECFAVRPTTTFPPPFMSNVDLRIHPDDAGFRDGSGSGDPRMRGWFRLAGDQPLDTHALVLAT